MAEKIKKGQKITTLSKTGAAGSQDDAGAAENEEPGAGEKAGKLAAHEVSAWFFRRKAKRGGGNRAFTEDPERFAAAIDDS